MWFLTRLPVHQDGKKKAKTLHGNQVFSSGRKRYTQVSERTEAITNVKNVLHQGKKASATTCRDYQMSAPGTEHVIQRYKKKKKKKVPAIN